MAKKTKKPKRDTAVDQELIESLKDLPPTLGACVDELYTIREQRYELQRKVADIAAREKVLTDHLIEKLPMSDAHGIAGKRARVTVKLKQVPQVEDWEKLHAYIKKNGDKGAWALLQRRVNDATVKEIWDSGKKVPGVTAFQTKVLGINKL